MMNSKELKEYLLEDINRIDIILENAGFHDIQHLDGEVRCALPGRNNSSSVSVKLNSNLSTAIYSKNYYGDLFGALEKILDMSFKETLIYVSSLFGLSNGKYVASENPLNELLAFTNSNRNKDNSSNKQFSKVILNKFIFLPHESLFYEGISPSVCKQFNVCFDPEKSRIIFPHFDWENSDKIVGIKGRTTFNKEIIDNLNIPKYWNYIKGYKKTHNLYGFSLARNNLEKSKMIILFEAEKSVLKQFTITRGRGYSVALGGHSISEEQVEFILKNTPGDCEVVLAFDKDVITDPDFGEEGFKEIADKFKPFRKVSYICDRYNVLGEKDAPIDKGVKIWNVLLDFRKEI
ncbi:DNA primase [Lactobacillus sp. AN1001]